MDWLIDWMIDWIAQWCSIDWLITSIDSFFNVGKQRRFSSRPSHWLSVQLLGQGIADQAEDVGEVRPGPVDEVFQFTWQGLRLRNGLRLGPEPRVQQRRQEAPNPPQLLLRGQEAARKDVTRVRLFIVHLRFRPFERDNMSLRIFRGGTVFSP